ncbi:MAG: methylated-DNA--[protein]-cysteine S-methyltransferase [Betaproteobacteria bacterium]|nr:methylated-DNA--[protein]-cysteine S-methyltransferase [Betaproteobacteria bacterium]
MSPNPFYRGAIPPAECRADLTRQFSQPTTQLLPAHRLTAAWLDSPLGTLLAIADDGGLYLLDFIDRRGLKGEISRLQKTATIALGSHPVLEQTARELKHYFMGIRQPFSIPLAARGTPFQRAAWEQLLTIPLGETRSYSDMAQSLGKPSAIRAVARANGDNYRSIVIPCHRVIGSDGNLTGYGGGLARKQWLLEHERGIAKPS